jgi:hypothetical protein
MTARAYRSSMPVSCRRADVPEYGIDPPCPLATHLTAARSAQPTVNEQACRSGESLMVTVPCAPGRVVAVLRFDALYLRLDKPSRYVAIVLCS